jgi:hypothetical protein
LSQELQELRESQEPDRSAPISMRSLAALERANGDAALLATARKRSRRR